MLFIDVGFMQSCSYDNSFYCAKTKFYGITLKGEKIRVVNIIETKDKLIFDINKTLTKAELKQIKSLYAAKYNRSSYNRSSKKIKIKKREKING